MSIDGAQKVAGDLSPIELMSTHTDFARLALPYQCAISALTTKVTIVKDELTQADHYCPIRHVAFRLKTPESILGKAARIACPPTFDAIRANILDIAGVRVTCGLVSDIYRLATLLSQHADLSVIEVEDYVAHSKLNGYNGFHMIIEVPVYLSDRVERVPVELQIRTTAMDLWANLERRIADIHSHAVPRRLLNELNDAAVAVRRLDAKMQRLYDEAHEINVGHHGQNGLHLPAPLTMDGRQPDRGRYL